MILTIEVIEKSEFIDGTIALVFGGHGTGIVGASGDDARLATQAALTAYWKAQDAAEQAKTAQAGIASGTLSDTSFTLGLHGSVTRGVMGISRLLRDAQDEARRVRIEYRAADGQRTTRIVHPTHVADYIVTTYDELSGEARTFRIDRIESAQVLA